MLVKGPPLRIAAARAACYRSRRAAGADLSSSASLASAANPAQSTTGGSDQP